MRRLGLPATLPWYPMLCLLPLGLLSLAMATSTRLREASTTRARRAQRAYLKVLQGDTQAQPASGAQRAS